MPEFSALAPAAGSNGRIGCATASVERNHQRALRCWCSALRYAKLHPMS
ncbi:MAG: hypothetical protein Q8K74_08550 [Candidatus Nitrotoga sp.]|nr:hypothetical protein [Candidatus Nitrotoga sp.]MDP1856084.1 hypothetical protein [Candidatus Nitrotoga sp.]